MKENKYSLWLMPKGESYELLSGIIRKLSREYSTPYFEPHVTLLNDIESSKDDVFLKSRELARSLKPFSVKLGKIESSSQYLLCLFSKVEANPRIMYANAAARKLLGRESDPPYLPHLSLMYGDFVDEIKEKIIKTLDVNLDVTFEAESLRVYLSDPEVSKWKKIKEYSFDTEVV